MLLCSCDGHITQQGMLCGRWSGLLQAATASLQSTAGLQQVTWLVLAPCRNCANDGAGYPPACLCIITTFHVPHVIRLLFKPSWSHSAYSCNCCPALCFPPTRQLPTLRWLIWQGAPADRSTMASAAASGNTAVLAYLRTVLPADAWDMWTCRAAAAEGRLETLGWLQKQQPPCPMDVQVRTKAASYCNLLPIH
jgi:hypothetical protein